jgi:hypothetical protein
MDTENESLPTGERASIEQQTDTRASVPPKTGNIPLVSQAVTTLPDIQWISLFLEGIRPTSGSHSTPEASVDRGKKLPAQGR